MSSPATVEMDTMISDFSTSLLNVAEADKKVKKEQIKKCNHADDRNFRNNRKPSENFNLNSVLSQIRDNGSAYVDTARQDFRQENNKPKAVQSDEKIENSQTKNSQNRDYYQNEQMADDKLHLSSKKISEGKLLHHLTRTQLFSLIAFSTVIVGAAMYMLDSYVNSSIKETVQHVNPTVNHDTEEKMEGEILRASGLGKSGVSAPDLIVPSFIVPSLMAYDLIVSGEIKLPGMLPEETNKLSFITSSVSELTNEVRSLRKELEQVREKIALGKIKAEQVKVESESVKIEQVKVEQVKLEAFINDPDVTVRNITVKAKNTRIINSIAKAPEASIMKPSVKKPGVTKPVENKLVDKGSFVETKDKTSEELPLVEVISKQSNSVLTKSTLTVKLVSLSNKLKANEIFNGLDTTEVSTQLEEALVNGNHVYRISVTGFKDRDKATLFIQNAANKYGIKGSRIIKTNLQL